ncbi:MAG: succinylglutamate-semialdehyde dehydrogenase [Pseudomonadota bacterium]
MLTGELWIDGTWRKGSGASFSSEEPATGERFFTGHMANLQDADAALEAAAQAFDPWRKMPLDDRVEIITKFTDRLTANKDALAKLISKETGKPLWDAAGEVGAMIGKAAISLKAYHDRTGVEEAEMPFGARQLSYRPHGVMLVIGPFNFPGHLPNGHIVPALIAGNTVVFKPSELTPATAEFVMRAWAEAGLPPGVINLVHGDREIAETLIKDPRTAGVLFTGGVSAGLAIHRALAGEPNKILALELGGNNPIIAWNVADADAAARMIARSCYLSSGQRCTCAKRLIVGPHADGDRVIAAVKALLPRLRLGAPEDDPAPFLGPLISANAAAHVISQQTRLIESGADPIHPAQVSGLGDAYVTPGMIDVTRVPDRPDEEIFGPVLQVIRVADFNAALAEANNTRFGLAAGLISDDRALYEQFSQEIRAGIVNWNRPTNGASSAAPFGGVGLSGNHRPAGYSSADYVAWPMAGLVAPGAARDDEAFPGLIE